MTDFKDLISQFVDSCAKEMYIQITSVSIFPSEAKEILTNIESSLANINESNFIFVLQNLKTKYPQLDKIFDQFLVQYQETQEITKTQETIKQLTKTKPQNTI